MTSQDDHLPTQQIFEWAGISKIRMLSNFKYRNMSNTVYALEYICIERGDFVTAEMFGCWRNTWNLKLCNYHSCFLGFVV